ncbi:MAG TPA: hypothetical protein ENK18_22405 [Deltaproteobacteria bacterium]|nr:hypothetical protein [Deltaproteobacteria bacterium]
MAMIQLALLAPMAVAADLTQEQLADVLAFRDQHLQIREVQTVIPGTVSVMRSGWGWGRRPWRGYAWDTRDVIRTPPEVMHEWVVFQGPQRLTVPEFLDVVGRHGEADALMERITRSEKTSRSFGAASLGGVAAGVAGVVGVLVAPPDQQPTFSAIGLGGLGTAILGGLVSSVSASRSATLAHDFPSAIDLEVASEEVREHNEELRERLGVSPRTAYRELSRDPRRVRGP